MTTTVPDDRAAARTSAGTERMWTARLRNGVLGQLPPEKLLPDEQPAYVCSWIYVFGVLTIAALVVILASGCVLAFEGPQWYHGSAVGHFFNSLHFWSVQLFFFTMVIHLWGKFWMAAWRGRRVATWVTGVVAFLASIGTAFTGYVVQTNFDSQWIASEAKDGLNSVGIGAWFNVLNVGQALLVHVVLLPLVLGVIVVWHVLLVRRRGVVPPIDHPDPPDLQAWRGRSQTALRHRQGVRHRADRGQPAHDRSLGGSSVRRTRRRSGSRTGPRRRRPTSSPPPRPSSTAPAARRATARPMSTSRAPGSTSARSGCRSGRASGSRWTPRRTS